MPLYHELQQTADGRRGYTSARLVEDVTEHCSLSRLPRA